MISTANNQGKQNQFVADEDKNDFPVLKNSSLTCRPTTRRNCKLWSQQFRLDYLKSRCKKQGLKLELGKGGGEPHTSTYGHVSLTGIANVDLADFGDIFPEVKVKTLHN